MNLPYSRTRSAGPKAFTLIELLVVITIIAVLAGLLLPVSQRVLENSRKVSAKSTETQIIAAVNAYQTDYGQYPVDPSAAATTTTQADETFGLDKTSHNGILFDTLRALHDPTVTPLQNSRRVIYFESKNVKSATNPRDGFIANGAPTGNPKSSPVVILTVGDLVDPWGNMYCVRIDTGYTNCVKNPYADPKVTADDTPTQASDPKNTDVLRTGVVSWTWGADGVLGSPGLTFTAPYSPTPGDDVDSWQ